MEQAEQHNPAGPLHLILTKALAHANTSGIVGHAGNFWATVFDVQHSAKKRVSGLALHEVISRLFQLDKLIQDTEESLKRIADLPERYFRPFGRIRHIPLQSLGALNTDITGTIKQITEGDMTVLEFCSEKLEAVYTNLE